MKYSLDFEREELQVILAAFEWLVGKFDGEGVSEIEKAMYKATITILEPIESKIKLALEEPRGQA